MDQAVQIELGHELFDYIDNSSTATMSSLYHQPVKEYICDSVAQTEVDTLFRSMPLCVGLSGLLPDPGSFHVHDISGLPFLLTRDQHGKVHAFLNVCRHRGARVAEGCGKTRGFTCPYHAWSYGLDGRLVARPEDASFEQADKSKHGLTPLAVEERDGLIWLSPTPGVPLDLNNHLNALGPELASYNLSGFHLYESRLLKRRMNWKLLLDTFLESYHFCVLHKDSICSIFYDNLTAFETWGPHFRLVSARRTIEEIRSQAPEQWNLLPHMVGIYVLFPNTVLIWQLDHIELWQIFPGDDAPENSVVQLSLYSPEPATSEAAKEHWDKNLDLVVHVVENEDFPVGEGIQRGFHTNAQDHIVFGCNEPALAHFHQAVTQAIGEKSAS